MVTDTHLAGSPGQWYNLPIIGTDSSLTRTASATLLVGGAQVHLPVILK